MSERRKRSGVVSIRLDGDLIDIQKKRKLDLRTILSTAIRSQGEPSELVRMRMAARQVEFEAAQEQDRQSLEAAIDRETDIRKINLQRGLVDKFDYRYGEKVGREKSIRQTDLDEFRRIEQADDWLKERKLDINDFRFALTNRYRVQIVEMTRR
jgi:hypothetical protein